MTEGAFKVTGLAPVLHVKEMTAALAYYRDKLGFAVTYSWEDPPRYVCLCRDDAASHLNSYVPPDAPAHIQLFCNGVDALYAQLAARGVAVTEPLEDRPYGMRDFTVLDPDGNRLVFGQALSRN